MVKGVKMAHDTQQHSAFLWYVSVAYVFYLQGPIGLFLYYILLQTLYFILYKCFKLEKMSAADDMFFREDPRQGGSLIAFQKIERVQTELFTR
jgi:hypothetical protein